MKKYLIYKLARKVEDKCCNIHNGLQWKEPCYIKVRDDYSDWKPTSCLDLIGQKVMFHRGFGLEYIITSPVQGVHTSESEYDSEWVSHLKPGDLLIETKNSYYLAEATNGV